MSESKEQRAAGGLDAWEALRRADEDCVIAVASHEARLRLDDAIARSVGVLAGGEAGPLVVALVGPSGAGKSSLINALAGSEIARSSSLRPTTRALTVYHPRGLARLGIDADLIEHATLVEHERAELRGLVLVDTPDVDTFVRSNRELTVRLLKSAGAALWVLSPERYMEERVWSLLRTELSWSRATIVLNKADLAGERELARIERDVLACLDALGLPRVVVLRAVSRPSGSADDRAAGGLLDVGSVRSLITEKLAGTEGAKIALSQRARAMAGLEDASLSLVPELDPSALEQARARMGVIAAESGARLAAIAAPAIRSAAAHVAGERAIARQRRCFGTLRWWLTVAEMPALIRRRLEGTSAISFGPWRQPRAAAAGEPSAPGSPGPAESARRTGHHTSASSMAEDHASTRSELATARASAGAAIDALAMLHRGLPSVVDDGSLDAFTVSLSSMASDRAERDGGTQGALVAIVCSACSLLCAVASAGLLGLGLYHVGRETLLGRFDGLAVAGHMLVLILGAHALAHGLVVLAAPCRAGAIERVRSRQVAAHASASILAWLDAFESAWEADRALVQSRCREVLRDCLGTAVAEA